MKQYFQNLKYDLPASIVVFLVALPLCLGIAVASKVDPITGLISGIVGGIVVGTISGSHLSVSGPAAGLIPIVIAAIASLGSFEAFLLALFFAGILQLAFGLMRAGLIGMYFPSAVIKGMLAAIGLILILKQAPHLVGADQDAFGEMEFWQEGGFNTFSFLGQAVNNFYLGSLIVGLVSLALLIMWERPFFKKHPVLSQIPGGVVVVALGVGLNFLFDQMHSSLAIHDSHAVQIPVFASFAEMGSIFRSPDWSVIGEKGVYITAVTLAIVASLETLLSVQAVDKLDPHKRRTPQNRELIAQGVGNMVCGLIGGLPITAVIVRSSANTNAGARTKVSAIVHGFLLLIAVALLPVVMNEIPLASLAAILVMVGFKLTKPALYKYHWKLGWDQFIPFVVTVGAILLTDLLVGIGIGLVVGIFFILKANYRVPYHYSKEEIEPDGNHRITVRLSEHVSFLNKVRLQVMLENVPKGSELIIDGSRTEDIDHDALEVIHNFKEVAHERGIRMGFLNVPDLVKH